MTRAAGVEVGEAAAVAGWPALARTLVDLVSLSKPRITIMVVTTGLGGMWLARRTGAVTALDWPLVLWTLVGLALVVGSANAFNMILERKTDALMQRTANRPLPSGRMGLKTALAFALGAGALGLPLLWIWVNALTAVLAGLALASYVLVYTPLKRVTCRALVIGAVPGAMPPLLGWTAVTGELAWPGVFLFLVLFFWQLPHFIAIATFRRGEYESAGIKVLPAERGERVARVHALIYSVALLATSLALVPLGLGGVVYLTNALVFGALFVGVAVWGLSARALGESALRWSRTLFAVSLVYLPILIAAMMVGV